MYDYRDRFAQSTPGTSIFGASSVETKMLFVGLDKDSLVSDVSHHTLVGGGE